MDCRCHICGKLIENLEIYQDHLKSFHPNRACDFEDEIETNFILNKSQSSTNAVNGNAVTWEGIIEELFDGTPENAVTDAENTPEIVNFIWSDEGLIQSNQRHLKNYRCEECSKIFRSIHELNRHLKAKNDANYNPKFAEGQGFICCGNLYQNFAKFVLHEYHCHRSITANKCPACEFSSASKAHRNQHFRSEHPNCLNFRKSSRQRYVLITNKDQREISNANISVPSDKTVGKYRCDECPRSFNSFGYAKLHQLHLKPLHPNCEITFCESGIQANFVSNKSQSSKNAVDGKVLTWEAIIEELFDETPENGVTDAMNGKNASKSGNFTWSDEDLRVTSPNISVQSHPRDQQQFTTHKRIYNPKFEDGKGFNCCGNLYGTFEKLFRHEYKCHRSTTAYKCPVCEFSCDSKILRNDHFRSVHPNCANFLRINPESPSTEKSGIQITKNQRTSTNEGFKNYQCDKCSKKFMSLFHMKRHLATHENDAKYNPTYEAGKGVRCCGKVYHTRKKFHKHEFSCHRSITKFKCLICGLMCVNRSDRINHIYGNHKNCKKK